MPTLIGFKPSIGRYRFTTVIDGDQYVFRVRWNSLEEAWYFDILEYDGTPIVTGVKVVLGCYLARRTNHPLLLRGVFLARSFAQVHKDPGFDDLGVTVQVFYYTRGDVVSQMLGSISEAT